MVDTMQSLVAAIAQQARPLAPAPPALIADLAPVTGIEAVLFDTAGTLFVAPTDSPSPTEAMAAALEGAGFTVSCDTTAPIAAEMYLQLLDDERSIRRTEGTKYPEVDIRHIVASLAAQLIEREMMEGVLDAYSIMRLAVEYETRLNPMWPMPQAKETLHALTERGYHLGILANGQFHSPLQFQALFGNSLEELGFDNNLCVWSFEVLEAKPSRRLFDCVLDTLDTRYSVARDAVLYVGNDRLEDLWPASEEGCRTALFAGDADSVDQRTDDNRCASVVPDLTLTCLSQLLEVLE